MASIDPRVRRLIIQRAKKYGVDPAAALAVAMGEGGVRWGAVGDQGQSHGPFQLKVGGANPYKGEKARKFANSAAGIDYAIRKMSESGAKGLLGEAAVNAIVRHFERPADPDTSVANAIGRLGKIPAPKPANTAMPARPPADLTAAIPAQARGTLNEIFAKVGLKPLDIVGDLPLPSVPGQRTAAPSGKATAAPAPLPQKQPRVQRMVGLIDYAQQLGLRISENPYVDDVDPVHVKGSHHYQVLGKAKGKKVGRAIDVSGDAAALKKFWAYAERYAGQGLDDMFWDPQGYSYDRGRRWNKTIGNHGDHLHLSVK